MYIKKENLLDLIDQQRINLAEVANLNLEDVAKIINNFQNPALLQVFSLENNEGVKLTATHNGEVYGFVTPEGDIFI